MKRVTMILALLIPLLWAGPLRADDDPNNQGRKRHKLEEEQGVSNQKPAEAPAKHERMARPAQRHGQAEKTQAQEAPAQPKRQRINLGHSEAQRNFHQNQESRVNVARPRRERREQKSEAPRQVENHAEREGNVLHHKAYRQDEGRERLKTLGVTSIPEHIANRAHILDSDRDHSHITLPSHGREGQAIKHILVGAKQWNEPVVRSHMELLGGHARIESVVRFNDTERERDHYYWHHDEGGYDYCHYYDSWGFHWYGWYVGERQFWTRYYADRWWFYDDGFGRWCFWNGGHWWWQDPYHVGDLYLYDNDQYVPSNPDDSEDISTIESPDARTFRSADDTREVKIMGESKDAFLYDTAIPPTFKPLYLASKVASVKFSDTSKGGPLQIMLKLKDGSTDLFDAQGAYVDFGQEP